MPVCASSAAAAAGAAERRNRRGWRWRWVRDRVLGAAGLAARHQRVRILVVGCLGHALHPHCSVGARGTDAVSGSRCRSCAHLSPPPICTLATVAQISPFSTVLHALSAWIPSRPIRSHPERGVVCVHTATPSCSAHRAFRVCRWCADPLPVTAVSCRAETTVWMGRKSARTDSMDIV